jgi:hypothetical protein
LGKIENSKMEKVQLPFLKKEKKKDKHLTDKDHMIQFEVLGNLDEGEVAFAWTEERSGGGA